MRRKECIEWPPCAPPECVGVKNKENWRGNEPYIYYQARAQIVMSQGHDVLNIDLFNGIHLVARYFADQETKSHAALIVETGEWTKCVMQNVVNACAGMARNWNEVWYYSGSCEYKKWAWASDGDEKRVAVYFAGQERGGKYALLSWESNIQRDKRMSQLENKQERINCMLRELLPPIPEDFYRWMHEEVFGEKYLFQKKEEGKITLTCGACAETWTAKRGAGTGRKICPKCGRAVRATYREKHTAYETLFLFQPCRGSDKWAERIFLAFCTWEPGKETFVELDEQIRIIVKSGENWGDCYYEEYVDQDGKPLYWDTNPNNLRVKAGYLYGGTLAECRDRLPKKLKNAGLEILAAGHVKANYNNIVTTWHLKPWFEYLVKGGFTALVRETTVKPYSDWHRSQHLGERGRNAREVFRLSDGRICRLKQANGGYKMLSWLQYEETMGQKITTENMKYLTGHFWPDSSDVWKALSYVRSANVFAGYVRKQSKLTKETPAAVLTEWTDYLDMAEKQGLSLSHEMFYKPKNLKEAHDACVREAQLEEGRKKAEGILKKFPNVEKNLDAIRDKYTYTGKDFCITVPEGIPDIIHEGRALGHCIDSTDRYFDRINQGVSYLVFLRRSETPTVPWYTLEIEPGGTVRQQRTTGNNQNKADVEAYMPFIREWQGVVRQRMTTADREAAENSRNVRLLEYGELREKKEKVWHGKLAGLLLADVLESDLIESMV